MSSPRPSPLPAPPGAPVAAVVARTGPDAVRPGQDVEVWCRSLGRWSRGFVALDLDARGWQVQRRSDRSTLPVRFGDAELRPAAPARGR